MSRFLRLLHESDKGQALLDVCKHLRNGDKNSLCFEVSPKSFEKIPGKSFAYWVTEGVLGTYSRHSPFGAEGRAAWVGLQTNDDFQWLRLWWESTSAESNLFNLRPIAKGGSFSMYYADIYLCVRWGTSGELIKTWKLEQLRKGLITANNSKCWNEKVYFRPGLTWSLRSQIGFGMRALPAGCIFAHKGPAAFVDGDDPDLLLALLALVNSRSFCLLVSLQMAFGSYEVGVIQKTPAPKLTINQRQQLTNLSRRAWSLKYTLEVVSETSHAFALPSELYRRLSDYDQVAIRGELEKIQFEIDSLVFDIYDFNDDDRRALDGLNEYDNIAEADDDADEAKETDQSSDDSILSWAVGVAFGRFDWRLATGERKVPSAPMPFDPLPAKSPGMLSDAEGPFHANVGILVDDQGHPDDLTHIVEEVLGRVDIIVPDNVRDWLRRDFFIHHLHLYSKSRRKAPIYWPFSTTSGSYTIWTYYPSICSQTLFTAINDFIEPKLKQVADSTKDLRNKGSARSQDDEKQFESQQAFEMELIELRDVLLKIARNCQPNHDDGVQITAAPFWPLFQYKPWQKVLKETWTKLENGDYDWAHLAMNYWPERVREKCKTDKSLAIAHSEEDKFIDPDVKQKKNRGVAKK